MTTTIEAAGLAWIAARLELDRLKELRDPIDCELSLVDRDGQCWRWAPDQEDDQKRLRDPKDWCPSCKRREGFHREYMALHGRVVALKASLTKACKAAFFARRAGKVA